MTATSSSVPVSLTASGALASLSLSPSDDPSASSSSTSSAASSSPSKNPFDAGPSRNLSTILPGFLIAFICVIGIFLICGVFHGRRRRARLARRMPPVLVQPPGSVLPQVRTRKKKKRAVKPKLWEVDIKALSWHCDVEGLQPVAVELLADSKPNLPKLDEKRANRLLPSFTHSLPPEEDESPTQQAQVTVLLTMPAPNYQIDLRSREYVIGTTCLSFRPEDDTDDEDEKRGEESGRPEETRRLKQRFERFAFR